jgi:hypothetical protein
MVASPLDAAAAAALSFSSLIAAFFSLNQASGIFTFFIELRPFSAL